MTDTSKPTIESLSKQLAAMQSLLDALRAGTSGGESPEPLHEVQRKILDLLSPGVALRLTELARLTGTVRTGPHYHVKRLVNKGYVREITGTDGKGHDIKWVALVRDVPIPGVETAPLAAPTTRP